MRIWKGNLLSAAAPERLEVLEHSYLVADDDGILRYVGQELPQQYAGLPVEDWGDRLILQSFADMHLHAPQYPMVGLGMDLPLLEWLEQYTFPNEARFADPDFARQTCRRLAEELARCGTTRVCMFSSRHTDATLILMEELERAGVGGYVGKVNMDRQGGPALQETTEESKRETLRWLEACGQFRQVRPILTPRFTPSCTGELMEFLGNVAAERGLFVQSHLSENQKEMALVQSLCPDCGQYWETYEKYGLWKDHTVMAHCVHSDRRERAAMRKHGVLAVHCPDSNLNICSGIAPVKRMLQEGVWVALGSDIAGGAALSMLDVMSAAIRSSKARNIFCDDAVLTVAEAYYLATSAGHRYFGDKPGFAVGNPLHALVLDDGRLPEPARRLTLEERLERAIYRCDDRDIVAVCAAGRRIK